MTPGRTGFLHPVRMSVVVVDVVIISIISIIIK